MNTRMGALPYLAMTQEHYAHMLLTRRQPGDREKAIELLDKALVTARQLGMKLVVERVQATMTKI